jgi:outer membrane protein assembly factor BamB
MFVIGRYGQIVWNRAGVDWSNSSVRSALKKARQIARLKPLAIAVMAGFALALGTSQSAADPVKTSTYSNPAYGVSFQYPSNYTLKAGAQPNLNWGYLGPVEMNFIRPGGTTLAAIEMHHDSYPGTDFGMAFLRVSIDSGLDASECERFDAPDPRVPSLRPTPLPKITVGGIEFAEVDDGEGAMMHQRESRYYHVFRNNTCYEFELGLGTAGFGAVDGLKQMDRDDAFRKLQAVLATVKIGAANIPAPSSPIRSFTATLLPSGKPITYRIAWDVPSAGPQDLSIRPECHGWPNALSIWRIATGDGTESQQKCGQSIPLPSNQGFVLFRFNAEQHWVHLDLTLAVQGAKTASRTRTIILPPSPTIQMVFGGECGDRHDGHITADYDVTIFGTGFLAKDNTVRIGPAKLSAPLSETRDFLKVRLPASVPPGDYKLLVQNELGQSAEFPVVVVAPGPPQNVAPSKPVLNLVTNDPRLAAAPWPMFGHDPQHTGLSSYGAAANHGTLKWKFTTAAALFAPPAIGPDGTVYAGSADENLYAINPDGTQKWRFKTCSGITSSPAITADGAIYLSSEDGNLYAINAEDGTLRWKLPKGAGTAKSSPTIGPDGTIYLACGGLCAIDPSGFRKRKFATEGYASGSPAIDRNGVIYLGDQTCNNKGGGCTGNVYAVNPNGTLKWKLSTAGGIQASPTIATDGTIYVVDSKRDETLAMLPSQLYAVTAEGRLKWKFSAGERAVMNSSPAIGSDDTIYFSSADCNLYALNPDGRKKWTFRLCTWGYGGGLAMPSPVVAADGTIYVGDSLDNLLAINPDGTEKWRYASGTPPVPSVRGLTSATIGADDTVYVGSRDSGLYAIGRPLSAPRPAPTPVAAKVMVSPGTIDFGMLVARQTYVKMVRVMASDSNKVPVVLEGISVTGEHYSLAHSQCEAGQPLYPGKFCVFDFNFVPELTTGETELGEIVVTTNAEVVDPPGGRVPLSGGGKLWHPAR